MKKTFLSIVVSAVMFVPGFIRAQDDANGETAPELPKESLMEDRDYGKELRETHFKSFFDTIENLDAEGGYGYGYQESCDASVTFCGKNVLSYKLEIRHYYGGAHESCTIYVGTYRRGTSYGSKGTRVKLADIVTKKDLPKMQSLIYEAFKKELTARNVAFEVAADGTPVTGFDLPKPSENFYYDEKGLLHFVYNEYEIHCYAVGSFDLCIKWPVAGMN